MYVVVYSIGKKSDNCKSVLLLLLWKQLLALVLRLPLCSGLDSLIIVLPNTLSIEITFAFFSFAASIASSTSAVSPLCEIAIIKGIWGEVVLGNLEIQTQCKRWFVFGQ